MRSPSPYPFPSSHHHHHRTPFTPTLPLSPLAFGGVWWLWPLLSCPSLHCGGEEERGRKREAAAHYHHVPRGPLPACLPACPSCCSVQLWLSTRPRPAGILTLPESHVKSHCLKAPRLSHWLFIRWTIQTLTPSTAAKPLHWCWEDPLFEHGCGAPGPGAGARPAQPSTSAHLGRLPVGVQVLFRHAAVPGARRYLQHPGAGTAREREHDRDVSMMCHLLCMRLSVSTSVSDVLTCLDVGATASLIFSVCVQIITLSWCWISVEFWF